ncbi:MAG: hypothetical protein JWQ76_5023 [Ramlibacter sp.]|nr:hypothetical protein [Ramlibacter sp.]
MSHHQRKRSPATLASWLQRAMARATLHLPALSTLGTQLHQHASWHASGMQASLNALHENVTAVEWTPLSDMAAAQASRARLAIQAVKVRDCAEQALAAGDAFLQRSSNGAERLGPALADFLLEFRSLEKVVDRCGDWLQQMEEGLARQQEESPDVRVDELAALAERAIDLRSRLALLLAVDRSARNVHALADNLAATRPKLADAVEARIKPSCVLLGARLDHILQAASPSTRAATTLASARSDAQIWVTQSMSLALRVQTAQERLVREAAALRHRCGLLPQAGQDIDRLDGARLKLRRRAEMATTTAIEADSPGKPKAADFGHASVSH